jgi:glycosyltransferase involved in cell wall biosynthesis
MKITFLLPTDDLTGGNRVVASHARQLQALGHEVLAVVNAPQRITLREQWRAWRHGYWRSLRDRMRPVPGHVGQSGVPVKILERHRPIVASDLPDADFVIATWWETAVWMHELPAAKGRKVHLIQDYEVWTGAVADHEVDAALRMPNLKIAISNGLKQTLDTALGELGIQVLPNAVDRQLFDAPRRTRRPVPRVGFMYGRSHRKAADLYLQACERARQRLPELEVLAFSADAPAAALPLPPGTEFHLRPAQERIASLYASCDAWLFASRVDSFGLPVLEAMACRTPVIGVPVGAAPELLAGGAGRLVPAESPEAMADAIVSLCSGPAAQWQAMSDLAYQRAHGYSWPDATERLLDLLASADSSCKAEVKA